jgi:hypothetical protein
MSNDEQIDVAEEAIVVTPDIKPAERVMNPLPRWYPQTKSVPFRRSEYMVKNEFMHWAKSNGVGCSYSGNKHTMFIFGENAPKVAAMASGHTLYTVVIKED